MGSCWTVNQTVSYMTTITQIQTHHLALWQRRCFGWDRHDSLNFSPLVLVDKRIIPDVYTLAEILPSENKSRLKNSEEINFLSYTVNDFLQIQQLPLVFHYE